MTLLQCRMQNRPDFELMRSSLRAPEAHGPHPRPGPSRFVRDCVCNGLHDMNFTKRIGTDMT